MIVLMFCIVLLLMGWGIPPRLWAWESPHGNERGTLAKNSGRCALICLSRSFCCLYIQKDLMYLNWLEAGTAAGLKNTVIKMRRPTAVRTHRSTFGTSTSTVQVWTVNVLFYEEIFCFVCCRLGELGTCSHQNIPAGIDPPSLFLCLLQFIQPQRRAGFTLDFSFSHLWN